MHRLKEQARGPAEGFGALPSGVSDHGTHRQHRWAESHTEGCGSTGRTCSV